MSGNARRHAADPPDIGAAYWFAERAWPIVKDDPAARGALADALDAIFARDRAHREAGAAAAAWRFAQLMRWRDRGEPSCLAPIEHLVREALMLDPPEPESESEGTS